MTATYNESLLSDRDQARALLGDTAVPDNALHTDAHIDAVLLLTGSLAAGVAWLADELVARYGQEPDNVKLPSGLTVSFKERIPAWRDLASRMRQQLAATATAQAKTAHGVVLRGLPRPDYTLTDGNEVTDATTP